MECTVFASPASPLAPYDDYAKLMEEQLWRSHQVQYDEELPEDVTATDYDGAFRLFSNMYLNIPKEQLLRFEMGVRRPFGPMKKILTCSRGSENSYTPRWRTISRKTWTI